MKPPTSPTENESSGVNLTPMLDVVFILLIFFIVTASFVSETGLDVNKSEGNPDAPPDEAVILVAITQDNEIWIDRRLVDPRGVRDNIERLRLELPKGMVVIQADDRSHNKVLVQVMDAARQAGVYNVAIAANRE